MGGGKNKTFYFNGECFNHKPQSILLNGSFNGWRSKVNMIFDEMKNYWYANVNVPKCWWNWICNSKEPTETDESGNTNNICEKYFF